MVPSQLHRDVLNNSPSSRFAVDDMMQPCGKGFLRNAGGVVETVGGFVKINQLSKLE